ncbi:oxygen-independent coproporphyrinogen III oxidase [Nitratireductor alexandrii]|uniref:oxygen-independent coproporphyrinogen III oxidase n=1 Tax=Nitratireductor alexandrii TaxID=2448161 RepID=UPI000FD88821|nr:oxygen-independent coproporphyrinogen III oxidase [Nitratireductor alexandrii]
MTKDIIARAGEQVPRYTSYPTAPHFHAGIDATTAAQWVAALPADEPVSLYVHIPYCDRLCWFCACNTKQTLRYGPVQTYLRALHQEIATVGHLLRPDVAVKALHLGGGSPTMLRPDDLVALAGRLRAAFHFEPDAEISVEIDPNDMDDARFEALARIGMSRASIGVQDFDPKVQKAINREQSFALTKSVVDKARRHGARSVNLDLLYGLPHQTLESLTATIGQALSLGPDRVALFGYAHVPWFKKHQTMIDEAALPDGAGRLAQFQKARALIEAAGYQAIGFDHFALPGDPLAVAAREGRLHRNFQGYTEDDCATLIGLGPSSISRVPQGYLQNTPATAQYERLAAAGELATCRGIAFSPDDRARSWVIERLMCDFGFSARQAEELFGAHGHAIVVEAGRIAGEGADAMLERRDGDFVVRPEARPLVRTLAARFDRYLDIGAKRHSAAI